MDRGRQWPGWRGVGGHPAPSARAQGLLFPAPLPQHDADTHRLPTGTRRVAPTLARLDLEALGFARSRWGLLGLGTREGLGGASMPIRQTLAAAQRATFAVLLPNAKLKGMPTPMALGFLSRLTDGSHRRARCDGKQPVERPNSHGSGPSLAAEGATEDFSGGELCNGVALAHIDASTDFALLKVDFTAKRPKGMTSGPGRLPPRHRFAGISMRGSRYTHLATRWGRGKLSWTTLGSRLGHRPSTTGYLRDRLLDPGRTGMNHVSGQARTYVLDKALNYGTAEGPYWPRPPATFTRGGRVFNQSSFPTTPQERKW